MNKHCNHVQEKISCDLNLDFDEQKHLSACSHCQLVFMDHQNLVNLFRQEMSNVNVPENFSDNVMAAVEKWENEGDWFVTIGRKVQSAMNVPLIQYGSLATGFGLGLMTFVRFVAFIFIPA